MEEIIETAIEREMQSSYIDYAMSVIVGRALPDARDGLKPAQRRILYAMYMLNNVHDQPTKKSARIVGETIGKYHPHGDMAVYDTLVRMAQSFSMNHMLVQGQGNMGSVDGDPPAAQRYTEVRLNKIAEDMLEDIEKHAVRFAPNFDNTEEEPVTLPTRVPELLINGASGIAVGVATNILPHNLSETCDAISAYVDNPEITSKELLGYITGPDFPTGGTVFYSNQLMASYLTGRGAVTVRSKIEREHIKNHDAVVVTEIPYSVNKASLVENIAQLVRNKKVQGIHDLRDESGKEGIRIVIELKHDADGETVLNQLYKHTQLQASFPVMNIAVIGNRLVTLTLKDFMKVFVDYRVEVINNRTRYDLGVASDRLHIVEGLLVAVRDIDGVVATIKASSDTKEARAALIQKYTISEKQANAILDMKLSKLTNLEVNSLESEKKELQINIADFKDILEKPSRVFQIIKEETAEVKQKYSRARRTAISHEAIQENFDIESMIQDEETTIILTNNDYIKRIPTRLYKSQDRGGKGVISISLKEGDFVKQILSCMLKDYLLVISTTGRAYWLKAYMVPEEGRYSMGKAAVNLVKLSDGERVAAVINTRTFTDAYLNFVTSRGRLKRIEASSFSKPRSNGVKAMPLMEGDTLADVCLSDGKSQLFIATKSGKALRFDENDIRPMSRIAHGIRGMRVSTGDSVANILAAKASDMVASITELGYGKVTELEKYRLQHRGGKGVLNLKVNEKVGRVVKALKITPESNVMLISSKGLSITFPVETVRVTGRAASGVRLMRLDEESHIVDAQVVPKQDNVPQQQSGSN